jgi:hypothetical protein
VASWGTHLEPGQRWVSSTDAGVTITVEEPTQLRWRVRTDRGDEQELSAAEIKKRFQLIPR